MRKILFFFAWLFISNCLTAQKGKPDSIKQLLLNDKEDTTRILHLADLSYDTWNQIQILLWL